MATWASSQGLLEGGTFRLYRGGDGRACVAREWTDMPVLAFLSDFGVQDHYVGAMKGAALVVCPGATLVDVVHEIPPHDVEAGALALVAAYRSFPEQTVFVAVVDPGVGSARRPLAIQAGAYRFVGPDNG